MQKIEKYNDRHVQYNQKMTVVTNLCEKAFSVETFIKKRRQK